MFIYRIFNLIFFDKVNEYRDIKGQYLTVPFSYIEMAKCISRKIVMRTITFSESVKGYALFHSLIRRVRSGGHQIFYLIFYELV